MASNPLSILKKPTNIKTFLASTLFLLIGIFFCGFAAFFLATGYDEIWNGYDIWWLGVGWAATLISLGTTSLYLVFSPAARAPRSLIVLDILSILLLIFGYVDGFWL